MRESRQRRARAKGGEGKQRHEFARGTKNKGNRRSGGKAREAGRRRGEFKTQNNSPLLPSHPDRHHERHSSERHVRSHTPPTHPPTPIHVPWPLPTSLSLCTLLDHDYLPHRPTFRDTFESFTCTLSHSTSSRSASVKWLIRTATATTTKDEQGIALRPASNGFHHDPPRLLPSVYPSPIDSYSLLVIWRPAGILLQPTT